MSKETQIAFRESSSMPTLYDRIADPIAAAKEFGKALQASGMCGNREGVGTVVALACMFERRSPMEVIRRYHVMPSGQLQVRSDAVHADFRSRGGRVKWIKTGDDGELAQAAFTFEGVETIVSFSIDDARRAGLVTEKSNWIKRPGDMLRARCLTKGIKMICPEIWGGDDDFDPGVVTVSELLPKQVAPVKTAAPVVEAEVVAAKTAPTAPAPTTAPAPAAEPERLTTELAQQVVGVISAYGDDFLEKAFAFMKIRKWIPEDGNIMDLSVKRAKKIIESTDQFKALVEDPN